MGPLTKKVSNSPAPLTKKLSDSPIPAPKKIPSLMQVQVTRPVEDEPNPPKQKLQPNIWKDGCSPVVKNKEAKIAVSTVAQKMDKTEKSVNKRSRSPSKNKSQDNKAPRKNSPRREQRRSRSRDRSKRRSESRDTRDRDSKNKERRSNASTRSRSRERDRRRNKNDRSRSRSRDKRSGSTSRARRSKSGDRGSSSKSRIKRSRTRSGDKIKNKMQESDNLMLAFYEGGDFMDEEQEAGSSSQSRTKHPSGSTGTKSDQSKPSTSSSKPQPQSSKPSNLVQKPSTFTSKPSTLASRAQSAVNKFPEPTPTVSNTTSTQSKKLLPDPVKATGNFFMSSLNSANQRQDSPMRFATIGQGQSAPRSQGTPTRGEIIGATLNLTTKHPVSALYEYNRSMKYPPPKFKDRWGPGGGWAFDIELGPRSYSCPWFRDNKKAAKAEACRYALQQLGIHIP